MRYVLAARCHGISAIDFEKFEFCNYRAHKSTGSVIGIRIRLRLEVYSIWVLRNHLGHYWSFEWSNIETLIYMQVRWGSFWCLLFVEHEILYLHILVFQV